MTWLLIERIAGCERRALQAFHVPWRLTAGSDFRFWLREPARSHLNHATLYRSLAFLPMPPLRSSWRHIVLVPTAIDIARHTRAPRAIHHTRGEETCCRQTVRCVGAAVDHRDRVRICSGDAAAFQKWSSITSQTIRIERAAVRMATITCAQTGGVGALWPNSRLRRSFRECSRSAFSDGSIMPVTTVENFGAR